MKLEDFDYKLPKDLIAQYPIKERDKCRLMVLNRKTHQVEHKKFEDIAGYFSEGDCLVLNDTKVIPARLFGRRKTGGKVELFLIEIKDTMGEALLRPSARLKEGEEIILESGDKVEVLGRAAVGRFVKFPRSISDIIADVGHVPLPPYIDREDDDADKENYQTVYASKEGATASPTAGLHFTNELLDRIKAKGVRVAYVTLHTNYGTFAPVKADNVENHAMHHEYFELPSETEKAIIHSKGAGGRLFAVGTTTTRVLEHCASHIRNSFEPNRSASRSGYTDLFIYPGYRFKMVDCLITNFHLPKSTLLILVSAFAGHDFIKGAYRQAIEAGYRFFSYGDAMLIL
ncbi:MAG: tRNA preQ1(34) S-adenosylmethionine ribosyltransferase-isomerase QueA [Candidatus Omnitrophica bacterium]|nr:tRNA preQ1(34) S-adenosylmethionine ribosyltransferase-isomerase QueA [Candidatus Omnitrophota bacterium]MCM8790786.1 tRNA preQ1(34) S-adenosylmethionine ribosyltransferase-isomerase QueA [Candidatus Omnitrophota bacterium]